MDIKPFKDFPSPSEWGLADKLMNWKRKYEREIKDSITVRNHTDLFPRPPPVIFDQTYELTKEGAVWVQEVSQWYNKLMTIVDPEDIL